jgi:hypothetical protein
VILFHELCNVPDPGAVSDRRPAEFHDEPHSPSQFAVK